VRCYFHDVRPLIERGVHVVWDRSPLCYRAYMRAYDADLTWPEALIGLVPEPDVTVLLEVTPEIAVRRLLARDGELRPDQTAPLLERAAGAYHELARESRRVVVVDGSRSEDQVADAIRQVVPALAAAAIG